jgi:hypothetical protein
MKERTLRQRSGQILIIAVLVVSLLMLSTQMYIYEVGRPLEDIDGTNVNEFVFALNLASKHVVTGSLANISAGGPTSVLSTRLERWASFIGELYQFGKPNVSYAPRETAPYNNGTLLLWDTNGYGISSAFVDVDFALQDHQTTLQLSFAVNVTLSLQSRGNHETLHDSVKRVNVVCDVSGEGTPVLADNVTVLFLSGAWQRADAQSAYSFTDYGNGTYSVSFEADIPEESFIVATHIRDSRMIRVQANFTCTNTG